MMSCEVRLEIERKLSMHKLILSDLYAIWCHMTSYNVMWSHRYVYVRLRRRSDMYKVILWQIYVYIIRRHMTSYNVMWTHIKAEFVYVCLLLGYNVY